MRAQPPALISEIRLQRLIRQTHMPLTTQNRAHGTGPDYKLKLIYLPGRLWCLEEPDGTRSHPAKYEERIITGRYAAQTAHWGKQKVWLLSSEVPHVTIHPPLTLGLDD
jgi:hypothetical protein